MKKENKTKKFRLLWYSHPRVAIAMALLAVNLLVIALFTVLLALVSGNAFLDELSYLFTYTMCSDGIYDFVNQQDDLACFVIKIVLTVVQMIIFSGALIGFTTDILQTAIEKRINNIGKLNLTNHFVFLNWSSIGPNIIYDLSFLEGKKTVVILSDKGREAILNSIYDVFTENNAKMKNIKLFVKDGTPDSLKHLNDISLTSAKHIGILLPDEGGESSANISNNDLSAFKTLMTVLNTGTPANVVMEVEGNETVKKVEKFIAETDTSLQHKISTFSHNSVIGHILGRVIINPIYAPLFHKILSYEGSEFYGIEPMDLEEALYKFNDCIPIINYDDDLEIDENGHKTCDQLYILSENSKALGIRNTPLSCAKPLPFCEKIQREAFTLFVVSDSDRVSFVMDELNLYNQMNHVGIQYKVYSYSDDAEKIVEAIAAHPGNKKLLLLSAEQDGTFGHDAAVFTTLLSFKLSGKLQGNLPIFVEILNPKNMTALKSLGVASVIVSNKIISLYMVQLMTHPGSRRFYRDVIVENGDSENGNVDIDIIKAKEILVFEHDVLTFTSKSELVQSFFISSKKTRMCIGIKYAEDDNENIYFLCNQMDEPNNIVLHPEDELIVVKY